MNPKTTNKQTKFVFGETYHVFNKAISSDKLFITPRDYEFFLSKLRRFIAPFADLIAYCLIPNHFHVLLEIKEEESFPIGYSDRDEEDFSKIIMKPFRDFFNSYSKSFNNAHHRSGRLFLYPFKRILVDNENYSRYLINYIHRNPVHHGFTQNYGDWMYSSYNEYINKDSSTVNLEKGFALFSDFEEFIRFHEENKVVVGTEKYYFE